MLPLSIRMHLRTVLFAFLLPIVLGLDRKLTSKLNPGCDTCPGTLVYITAEGTHDTIHQIWDFTGGAPTVIFTLGKINSTVRILWNKSRPSRFILSEEPTYSFALAVNALYEYNDIKDEVQLDPQLPHRKYPFQGFNWTLVESSLNSPNEAMVKMHSGFHKWGEGKGQETNCFDVKLVLLPFKDYAPELPHLIHTANSTLIDIDLVNLTTYTAYNSSRFALEMVMVSTDDEHENMVVHTRKSLDDEHTPGVFEIVEVQSAGGAGSGGFVQFRPVAYSRARRGVDAAAAVRLAHLARTELPDFSSLSTFYKRFDRRHLLVEEFLITFGDPGDGFYKTFNYTSWSFTLGYGAPPLERFSLFVIMIISIGLGVPVLLALSGAAVVLARRCRRHNPPRRLTNEE